ncbi:hypothetical protein F0562_034147 [Nyssa sinensis]|uniref:Uncharacterized protein n=1 Tax=Nyssa sinensis TaxID=561372 RepID=A0A5J5AFI1_9ASTE|nr:hypothetical protein F0562_034147 [Nyssa sinensis]
MGEASIHNTYSAQSWVERAEEGEYIPQAAMDLEAEYGGFSEDPSFLIDSLHGGSSLPNLRGRGVFNNGSMHGGHGGRAGRGRVATKGDMIGYGGSNTQAVLGSDRSVDGDHTVTASFSDGAIHSASTLCAAEGDDRLTHRPVLLSEGTCKPPYSPINMPSFLPYKLPTPPTVQLTTTQ